MMKKSYWGIIALAALPPAVAAAAQHHHVGASACVASYNNDDLVMRGPNLLNWDTSSKSVGCAIPFTSNSVSPVTVNTSAARVDFMDYSASLAINCQLSIVTTNNTIVSSGWRYSCNTNPAGGCDTAENSYTGTSYLTFTDNINSTANVVGINVACNVPGYDYSWGASGLLGVAVSTSAP
jgi:hypothetical protein